MYGFVVCICHLCVSASRLGPNVRTCVCSICWFVNRVVVLCVNLCFCGIFVCDMHSFTILFPIQRSALSTSVYVCVVRPVHECQRVSFLTVRYLCQMYSYSLEYEKCDRESE